MLLESSTRGKVTSVAEIISSHARGLVAKGRDDLLYMNIGQPSTGAPKQAIQALSDYAKENILGYTPITGLPLLKESIAKHYLDQYKVQVDPARIFVTFGASGAFILVFLGLFDPGQRIALPLPCYPAYLHTMELLGIKPVLLPTKLENNYQPTIEDIEQLDGKIDGIVLTSPGNPTGSMLKPEELKALIDYCHTKDILLISDEIYHGIIYNQHIRAATALEYSNDLAVINSFSKYYSSPGWRCGWMVLPDNLMANLSNVARNMYISPNAPSQIVAAESFNCLAELDNHTKRYAINREILMTEMPKAGFVDAPAPDGAFYYYAKAEGLTEDSVDFCLRMLDEVGIAALAGSDFDPINGKHCVRFSYACDTPTVHEAVARLKQWRS